MGQTFLGRGPSRKARTFVEMEILDLLRHPSLGWQIRITVDPRLMLHRQTRLEVWWTDIPVVLIVLVGLRTNRFVQHLPGGSS